MKVALGMYSTTCHPAVQSSLTTQALPLENDNQEHTVRMVGVTAKANQHPREGTPAALSAPDAMRGVPQVGQEG